MLADEPAMAPPAPSEATETVPVSPTAPTVETTQEPPPTVAIPSAGGEADTETEDIPVQNGGRADLKVKIAGDAVAHLEALQSVLEKASPSVRSALYQAIIVSENGYKEALAALD